MPDAPIRPWPLSKTSARPTLAEWCLDERITDSRLTPRSSASRRLPRSPSGVWSDERSQAATSPEVLRLSRAHPVQRVICVSLCGKHAARIGAEFSEPSPLRSSSHASRRQSGQGGSLRIRKEVHRRLLLSHSDRRMLSIITGQAVRGLTTLTTRPNRALIRKLYSLRSHV